MRATVTLLLTLAFVVLPSGTIHSPCTLLNKLSLGIHGNNNGAFWCFYGDIYSRCKVLLCVTSYGSVRYGMPSQQLRGHMPESVQWDPLWKRRHMHLEVQMCIQWLLLLVVHISQPFTCPPNKQVLNHLNKLNVHSNNNDAVMVYH